MGKQSKRKNKRRSGGGKVTGPAGQVDASLSTGTGVAAASAPSSPVDRLVGKIRHGDPRVRHAALVALSSTLYDSHALSKAADAKKKKAARGAFATKGDKLAAEANNPALLRALAEKTLDADVPCAAAAMGCLSNYVFFYCGHDGATGAAATARPSDDDDDEIEVASDVMVPIVLQRIQGTLGVVRRLGSQMANATANTNAATNVKEIKKDNVVDSRKKGQVPAVPSVSAADKLWLSLEEQWSLLSLSLFTLAGLIENCPSAVQRVGPNSFPLAQSVLQLASDSLQCFTQSESKEGGMNSEGWEKTKKAVSNAAENASRALHSLLDDNASLISSLPLGSSAAAGSALMSVITQLTHTITNKQFSDVTRLHSLGAILSLRRVLVLEKEGSNGATEASQEEQELATALQSCTNDVVIPMLHSLFDVSTSDAADAFPLSAVPNQLVARMMSLSRKLSTLKQDEQIESQIVESVNARKEPARAIARRQKMTKEEKQQQQQHQKQESAKKQGINGEGDMETEMTIEAHGRGDDETKKMEEEACAMVVEEEEDSGVNPDNKNKGEDQDALKHELDVVVQSWKDFVGSYKLAFELVANLCSSVVAEDDEAEMTEGDVDEDEHMWDSDDEAKMLAAAGVMPSRAEETQNCTPAEQATYNSISANRLPEQILDHFQKWVMFLPSLNDVTNKKQDEKTESVPPPILVSDDVEEVLSTCALCLGNMAVMSNLLKWSGSTPSTLSQGRVVENTAQHFWWELESMLSSGNPPGGASKMHHVTSVMLSLLRSQPDLRAAVDAPTLDRLVVLLQRDQAKSHEGTAQLQSHVISMLGVLCSEEHSAEMDALVCHALLECLRCTMTEDSKASTTSGNFGNNAETHSIVITHEILNVLMDMYGGDDCHDLVFEKENVIDHFRRSLPGFKRRVKKVAKASNTTREEVLVWNETALNASRFIKYKGG